MVMGKNPSDSKAAKGSRRKARGLDSIEDFFHASYVLRL
jgi:hypothetical protein